MILVRHDRICDRITPHFSMQITSVANEADGQVNGERVSTDCVCKQQMFGTGARRFAN